MKQGVNVCGEAKAEGKPRLRSPMGEGEGVSLKSRASYLKPDDLTLGKMKSHDCGMEVCYRY